MLIFKDIIQSMREMRTPYFTSLKVRPSASSAETFLGKNSEADEKTVDQGINDLKKRVGIYENLPDAVFTVCFSKNRTGNHEGTLVGPFEFRVKAEQGVAGIPGAPPVQPAAADSPIMSMLNDKTVEAFGQLMGIQQTSTQKEIDLKIREANLDRDKQELERQRKQFEDDKREAKKELEALREKYDSRTEAAKEGTEAGIIKLIKMFGSEEGEKKGLGAAVEKIEEEASTPEHKAIESIAENINDTCKTMDQIVETGTVVELHLRKYKQNKDGVLKTG